MLLIVSLVVAFVPLLGIVWILVSGSLTTTDGLFLSLILLTISGVFGLNGLWEFQRLRRRAARASTGALAVAGVNGAALIRGRVESVQFFEAHVGQPNKSVVTLSKGSGASRILVLEGDLRNRLPAGKKVELIFRDEDGLKVLVSADYA
jgi:Kef-type K+ transport system membrane component KefB